MHLDGEIHDHSLLIGNYGDVDLTVTGSFDISGMIYLKGTLTLTVAGCGTIKLRGFCTKLIIHMVKGACSLELAELTSKQVSCYSLRDTSSLILGPTRVINLANVQDEAIFRYLSAPVVKHYSVAGKGKIETVAA